MIALRQPWTRADHNYLQRVKALRGDSAGANGAYRLNASTITDDAAADVLTGSTGRDWFFSTVVGPAKDGFSAAADEITTVVA